MGHVRRKQKILVLLILTIVLSQSIVVLAEGPESSGSNSETRYNVTEIYSVNNGLENCYYKPYLKDAGLIEDYVKENGNFVSAYTGYFDLNHTDEYKPSGSSNRALEILGYDFLLQSESFAEGEYKPVETLPNYVTRLTAVMDLYKALGLNKFDYTLSYASVPESTIKQSPAVVGLPTDKVNSSKGRTSVFITRTNPSLYKQKAITDLRFSSYDLSSTDSITAGDFIVLTMTMMNYYGAPVMSDQEMNAMLQVYGADVPTYLTSIQQDAYLYLKARGILNDDSIDFSKPVGLTQMLEILMCVKDEASRTSFKDIQVTMEVGDDLISKGYFPKTVELVDGADAIEVTKKIDFSKAEAYDYYVEVTKDTLFVDSKGNPVDTIFVPSIPEDPSSEALPKVKYNGIIDINGASYYHIQIPILTEDSNYMQLTNGWIQLNTLSNSDKPYYIWIEQGGGIYYNPVSDGEGGIILSRRDFSNAKEYELSVSVERVEGRSAYASEEIIQEDENVDASIEPSYSEEDEEETEETEEVEEENTNTEEGDSIWDIIGFDIKQRFNDNKLVFIKDGIKKISHFLFGEEIISMAAPSTTLEEVILYNASNIDRASIDSLGYVTVEGGPYQDSLKCTIPYGYSAPFLSSIVRDESKTKRIVFDGIATLHGDMLIKYSDLESKGLVYTTDGNLPVPDGNVLTLFTKYGRVVIDNDKRIIAAGNNVFKVTNANSVLFQYKSESGKAELYIDYRAAYGWTANIADIVVTGTSSRSSVNIITKDSTVSVTNVKDNWGVNPPEGFRGLGSSIKAGGLRKGIVDNESDKLVPSINYSLANYFIYYGVDNNGLETDYCVVYYPKASGIDGSEGSAKLKSILGFSIASEDWVCKVFNLKRDVNSTTGQFSYTEQFGYVYNLPMESEFSYDKYLSGEYILPIVVRTSGLKLVDYNVNSFTGFRYGTRPYADSTGKYYAIDGSNTKLEEVNVPGVISVSPAPVGVSMLFSGTGASGNVKDVGRLGVVGASNPIYIGATLCNANYDNTSGDITASINYTASGHSWSSSFVIDATDSVYQVNLIPTASNNITATYAWVGSSTVVQEALDGEKAEEEPIQVISDERVDEKGNLDGYSLDYLIKRIDEGTSWGILFCFVILPYIILILLTILIGCAFMADSKAFRTLCAKTIDPVWILCLGRKTIETIRLEDCILSSILGCTSAALIMNGNLFRIIQWAAAWFSVFMKLLRQI